MSDSDTSLSSAQDENESVADPIHVEELAPDGGPLNHYAPAKAAEAHADDAEPESEAETETEPESAIAAAASSILAPAAAALGDDDEPPPDLCWYVLKVQSGREDSIRDALDRRVKIQGLQRFFGPIIVPTEKVAEVRNNRKRIVERKTYPGYLILQMELNEKTWFTIRETPGVGDFVGAHGKPTKMTQAEVDKMLGPVNRPETEPTPTREHPPKLDVQRGDRVKIKDGPFENFEGTVEEIITARGQVKVMLMIFNRPTPVDLEYWQVERV